MRYLTLTEILELHRMVVEDSGGSAGVRDLGVLLSAVAQPRASFEGRDLYRSLESKATVLCFSLVMGHPFGDGNKRVGHAAMETFLVLNGHELAAGVEEAERVVLGLAEGTVDREQLLEWVRKRVRPLPKSDS